MLKDVNASIGTVSERIDSLVYHSLVIKLSLPCYYKIPFSWLYLRACSKRTSGCRYRSETRIRDRQEDLIEIIFRGDDHAQGRTTVHEKGYNSMRTSHC